MVRLRQQNSSFLLLEASHIKRKIDGNSYLINRNFGGTYDEKNDNGIMYIYLCVYFSCVFWTTNKRTTYFRCQCDNNRN